jgi:hypothetical protein
MTEPRMFVGSAEESEDMVDAIGMNLQKKIEVISWSDSFGSGEFILQRFLNAAKENLFGLFIFSPVDYTINGSSADEKMLPSPRDNVVMEAGAFLGRYGRHRTLMMEPSDVPEFKSPSDLNGLILIKYKHELVKNAEKSPARLRAALKIPCGEIWEQVSAALAAEEQSAAAPDDVSEPEIRQPEAEISTVGGAVDGASGWAFAVRGLSPIADSELFVGRQVAHGIYGLGQVVSLSTIDKVSYASVRFGSQHVSIPLQGRPEQLFDPFSMP